MTQLMNISVGMEFQQRAHLHISCSTAAFSQITVDFRSKLYLIELGKFRKISTSIKTSERDDTIEKLNPATNNHTQYQSRIKQRVEHKNAAVDDKQKFWGDVLS